MTRDLVFEIGTEELPSKPLYGAIEQLTVAVPKALRRRAPRVRHGARHGLAAPARRARERARRAAGRRGPQPQGPGVQGRVRRRGQAHEGRDRLRARQGRAGRVAAGRRGRQRLLRVRDGRGQGRLGRRGAAGPARAPRREHRVAEVAAVGKRRRALLASGALAARALRRRGRAGRVRRADRRPAHLRTPVPRAGRDRGARGRRLSRSLSSAARSSPTTSSGPGCCEKASRPRRRSSVRPRSCPRRRSPRS